MMFFIEEIFWNSGNGQNIRIMLKFALFLIHICFFFEVFWKSLFRNLNYSVLLSKIVFETEKFGHILIETLPQEKFDNSYFSRKSSNSCNSYQSSSSFSQFLGTFQDSLHFYVKSSSNWLIIDVKIMPAMSVWDCWCDFNQVTFSQSLELEIVIKPYNFPRKRRL